MLWGLQAKRQDTLSVVNPSLQSFASNILPMSTSSVLPMCSSRPDWPVNGTIPDNSDIYIANENAVPVSTHSKSAAGSGINDQNTCECS